LQVLAPSGTLNARAAHNIWFDGHVRIDVWNSLIVVLAQLPDADARNPAAVTAAIRSVFRRHTLKGKRAEVPQQIGMFGRAMAATEFTRHVLNTKAVGAPTGDVASARMRLAFGKPPAAARSILGDLPLGTHLMWSTFSPRHTALPFCGYDDSCDSVRANLGLDRRDAGLPLVLLEYDIEDKPRNLPTVVEAYAGDRWNYYFQPANGGASHGLTIPWDGWAAAQTLPRPEVVHEVVTLSMLRAPLRLLT
jgi:hypothetical protein